MENKMNGRIRVIIHPFGHPSNYDFDIYTELSTWIAKEVFVPIDEPSYNADAFARMLCTQEVTRKLVFNKRQEVKRQILEILGDRLDEAMSSHDTIMGYPKNVGSY